MYLLLTTYFTADGTETWTDELVFTSTSANGIVVASGTADYTLDATTWVLNNPSCMTKMVMLKFEGFAIIPEVLVGGQGTTQALLAYLFYNKATATFTIESAK